MERVSFSGFESNAVTAADLVDQNDQLTLYKFPPPLPGCAGPPH
jgi:hypothetical protein